MTMIGEIISHYKILEKLGEGGMGVVYKAEDLDLKRDVAIKFLPLQITASDEERSRFKIEAQAAAALNHPNIAHVYAVDEVDGQAFIAMEYIEGRSLEEVIHTPLIPPQGGTKGGVLPSRGESKGGVSLPDGHPLPLETAISYATQIAAGLQATHKKGITHRDIKSSNIMITEDGQVKIMDFGLAKISGGAQFTKVGTTLGTAAYMSPEQALGEEVDARTDIWAFGVVLYEMLSGKQPFAGDYEQAVIYSIINEDPEPLTALRTGVPMEVERIVSKALAKRADERYQSMDEMLTDLKTLKRKLESGLANARHIPPTPKNRRGLAYAGIAAGIVLLIAAIYFWQAGESDRLRQGDARLPAPLRVSLKQVTFSPDLEEYPAFSPEGLRIAYCRETDGHKHVFTKDFETGETTQRTSASFDNIQPAWSPDGSTLLFVRANRPGGRIGLSDIFGMHSDGDIWSIDLESGKERKLIEEAFNPAFSPDGQHIAFDASWAGPRRIWIADKLGRNPQQVSFDPSEEVAHVIPAWSPDGTKIVFQNMEKTKFDIKVVDVISKAITSITDDFFQDINPIWAQSGEAIYFSSFRSGGRNIWRVPVSKTGEPEGPPQQMTTGAGEDVQLAVSPDGKRLAFSILKLNADIWRLPVSPETGQATGGAEPLVATTREDSRGSWSPDGSMIAFNSDRTGEMNIWVHDLADGSERQLTRGPGGDYQPHWAPDGQRLVFFSSRAGNADIWTVERASGKLRQLTKEPSLEMNPFFSPDGRWIAYQSDSGGRREVWLMTADGKDQRRLTNIGVGLGHYFMWSRDSKLIFFRNFTERNLAMQVSLSGSDPQPFVHVAAGGHMSFSPDRSMIMDNDHKALWVTQVGSQTHSRVFEFDDPEVRIDYSVWSPDGKWVLFDLLKPQGGDIWVMENFE